MFKLKTFFQRFQQTKKDDLPSDTVTISFNELRLAFKPFADKYNYEKYLHVPSSLDKDVANIRRALKNVENNQAVTLRKILVTIDSQALASLQPPYPRVSEFHFTKYDLTNLYDELSFLEDLDHSYKDCRVIDMFNRSASFTIHAERSPYIELHDNLITMFEQHDIKPQWREFPIESRSSLPEDTPMVNVSITSLMDLVHPAHKNKKLSDIEELKQFLQTLYFDLKPDSYPDKFIVLRQTIADAITDLYYSLPEKFPTSSLGEQSVVRPIRPDIVIDGFPEASTTIPLQTLQALTNTKTSYLVESNDNNPLQHFNNHVHLLVNKHQSYAHPIAPQNSIRTLDA